MGVGILSKQLYTLYERELFPGHALPAWQSQGHIGNPRYISNFALIRWPDGRPCHLVNTWLLERASKTTARESCNTDASLITHLVRFCYVSALDFSSFDLAAFQSFRDLLLGGKKETKFGSKNARDRNQVGRIQRSALFFLEWLHLRHPVACPNPVVGVEGTGAKIVVEYKVDPVTKRIYMYHPMLVVSEPFQNDKAPISETMIQDIRDEIFRRSDVDNLPAASKLKYLADPEMYSASNKYLYERRMFLVRAFKLTGARTEELYDLPLAVNSEVLNTKELVLPTKKRRFAVSPRRFKVDLRDARLVSKYINARKYYQEFLAGRGFFYKKPDQFFLGANGADLKKSSLTKEFDRLCMDAGIVDTRSCLSMFRHRFITREIHARLLIRFANNPGLRNGVTPELRDDVCRDVLPLTGHAQIKSLWHYFDAEYDLMTSSSPYSEKLHAKAKLESLREDLTDMRYAERIRPYLDLASKIAELETEIDQLWTEILSTGG